LTGGREQPLYRSVCRAQADQPPIYFLYSAPGRHGLQFDDRSQNSEPDGLTLVVTAFELEPKVESAAHEGGTSGVIATGRIMATVIPGSI
jgi:hypothetical protein